MSSVCPIGILLELVLVPEFFEEGTPFKGVAVAEKDLLALRWGSGLLHWLTILTSFFRHIHSNIF